MQLLTSGQVCHAVGIPAPTLEKWVREGAITPVVESTGRGVNRLFSVAQTFAIAASRHLRHKEGKDLRTAGGVLDVLLRYTDDALGAAFAEHRNCLLVVNGNVMPRLTSAELGKENEELIAGITEAGIPCDVGIIHLEAPYRRLKKWLQSKERKSKVRT